jgi:hypothetical protein
LFNEGSNVVYVGGANVSPFNGLAIPPGSKPIEIQNAQFGTVYTCSNSAIGANTAAGTLSALFNAGGSSVAVSASYSTAITIGSTIILGTGTAAEVLVVSATAATTITTSTTTLYDHKTASVLTLANSTPGQLRVTAGV